MEAGERLGQDSSSQPPWEPAVQTPKSHLDSQAPDHEKVKSRLSHQGTDVSCRFEWGRGPGLTRKLLPQGTSDGGGSDHPCRCSWGSATAAAAVLALGPDAGGKLQSWEAGPCRSPRMRSFSFLLVPSGLPQPHQRGAGPLERDPGTTPST